MGAVFEYLTHAIAQSVLVALGASFAWGVLSILLSPCHLSSIPLVVGFINGQPDMTTRRALGLSSLFAVGILVTIAVIGAMTASAGRIMGDLGSFGNYLVAAVFLVVGLGLLDVIPLGWSGPGMGRWSWRGPWAALVLGLVFGVALGPCTFAYMAPMLAVTFKVAADNFAYGAMLLLAYGLGHCLVIAVAGAGTEWVQKTLDWNEKSRGSRILKTVCGVLVIMGGLYMIYTSH